MRSGCACHLRHPVGAGERMYEQTLATVVYASLRRPVFDSCESVLGESGRAKALARYDDVIRMRAIQRAGTHQSQSGPCAG